MRVLPALVAQLVTIYDAWIIGSGAIKDADLSALRDFDVLVPWDQWKYAAILIPAEAKPNTFGGWKATSEGRTVDIWPGDLVWTMQSHMFRAAWHPKTNVRVTVEVPLSR